MPSVRQLRYLCEEWDIPLQSFWTKQQIIIEIQRQTGMIVQLYQEETEVKKDESKQLQKFLRELQHDTAYFTRDEWIEINGIEDVLHLEKHYKHHLRFDR